MSDDTERDQGVDFAGINPVLEDVTYPITSAELVADHGDRELERTNAEPISVRELLDHMGEQTFESAEEVRQQLLNQMPESSVGRQNYTDRGGAQPEETEEVADMGEDETV